MVAPEKSAPPHELCLPFDKLRERSSKKLFFPFLSARAIYGPEHIACLLYGELPVQRVVRVQLAVVHEVIRHLRNELAAEALSYSRIGVHYGVKLLSGVHQVRVRELKQR